MIQYSAMNVGGVIAAAWFLTGMAQADTLNVVSSFVWEHEAIVGLSGLEVSDDGATFVTISDRGWYIAGEFLRAEGEIKGADIQEHLPILGQDGLPVAARRIGDWSDAEGLAIAQNGTFWVSFERWARVSQFTSPEVAGTWIRDHPTFQQYDDNRQLEAVAVDANGTVYTFPENPTDDGFPIYQLNGADWEVRGHIAPSDGFALVGADFGPDGQLFLLERKLVLGLWWQNRVRRLEDVTNPDDIETLWTSKRGAYDNLEGIAVWQDQRGLRVTLVSDNNGDKDEPTTFVELQLVD